eukprot:TRINITY_DN182_c2_g1_i1.p1 TRINITY_DN182_c2_g1~~TRINITY_DN182_c2_g1_i1.p1  ORF type:complete len:250 (+),score=60.26 TRINITY_DN182_c2_g1_i1:82-831(+)
MDFPSPRTQCYPCPHCQETFSLRKLLSRHLRVIHTSYPEHECSICLQRCRSQSELLIHSRTHSSSSAKEHVCEICGLKLDSRIAVRRHVRIHTRPEVKELSDMEEEDEDEQEDIRGASYECMLCQKSFKQKSHLSFHEKTLHQGLSRLHLCHTCGKTFSSASNLKKHIGLRHNDPQGHVCEFCGRVYKELRYLLIHVKTHSSGEKDPHFFCRECEEEFPSRAALKIHRRVSHGGGALFPCSLCPRARPS